MVLRSGYLKKIRSFIVTKVMNVQVVATFGIAT